MYTFVYRTFIKFMFFCRGQALDASESALCRSWVKWRFNALMGLSCYDGSRKFVQAIKERFQCPHGLELLLTVPMLAYLHFPVSMPSWAWVVTSLLGDVLLIYASFNALMGLSCYQNQTLRHATLDSFNALSGLYLISTVWHCKRSD